ncbi:uncharacterized protein VTP21DRAFT_10241 [Calcarisporiella thermophila]|uniref:uncharacterized protein n=1 Tax=Calcarisporiella thermophila TaxID=911321 RepID=UPI003742BBEF
MLWILLVSFGATTISHQVSFRDWPKIHSLKLGTHKNMTSSMRLASLIQLILHGQIAFAGAKGGWESGIVYLAYHERHLCLLGQTSESQIGPPRDVEYLLPYIQCRTFDCAQVTSEPLEFFLESELRDCQNDEILKLIIQTASGSTSSSDEHLHSICVDSQIFTEADNWYILMINRAWTLGGVYNIFSLKGLEFERTKYLMYAAQVMILRASSIPMGSIRRIKCILEASPGFAFGVLLFINDGKSDNGKLVGNSTELNWQQSHVAFNGSELQCSVSYWYIDMIQSGVSGPGIWPRLEWPARDAAVFANEKHPGHNYLCLYSCICYNSTLPEWNSYSRYDNYAAGGGIVLCCCDGNVALLTAQTMG